jgi:hypothetical protein
MGNGLILDWQDSEMEDSKKIGEIALAATQTRMTHSFPTVLSAPPSESEKCRFNNVNGSHLTAHSFGVVEREARARSR